MRRGEILGGRACGEGRLGGSCMHHLDRLVLHEEVTAVGLLEGLVPHLREGERRAEKGQRRPSMATRINGTAKAKYGPGL